MSNVYQPSSKKPITDPRVGKVCDLAGLSRATERLATLQQLKKGIDLSLAEIDRSKKGADFLNNALALTKFTRATCDAFISMAAALSSAVLPGVSQGAAYVKAGYSSLSVVVDASVRNSLGEKVSYVDVVGDVAQEATGFIPQKFGAATFLAQNAVYKGEILAAAVKGDKGRVLDKAKDYGIELGKYSLDALKDEGSSSLKNTGVDAAKAYIDVSKAAFAYNDAIEKITDELLSNQEATASQHASLKVMLLRQARSLQAKIDEIQDLLSSCNIQLA